MKSAMRMPSSLETWDQFSLQADSNPLSNHTRLAQLVQIYIRQLRQFT
jgi:hypothetical protein